MHETHETAGTVVVGSSRAVIGRARATVRSVGAVGGPPCLVVDLDGSYLPIGRERVVDLVELAESRGILLEAVRAAATLEPDDLELYAGAAAAEHALALGSRAVLVLRPGVHLLQDASDLLAAGSGPVVVPGTDAAGAIARVDADRAVTRVVGQPGRTTTTGPGAGPLWSRSLVVLRTGSDAALLRSLAASWRLAPDALDLFAVEVGARVVTDDVVLVGPWRAVPPSADGPDGRPTVGGSALLALDLSGLDPRRPWLLATESPAAPRVRLSEHPALARVTANEAAARLADHVTPEPPTGARRLLDPALRAEARRADASGAPLPDVLGAGEGPSPEEWALELVRSGDRAPVARHLAAVRQARRDLRTRFRRVPGADASGLAEWATEHGVFETEYDADLLRRAAAATLGATPVEPPAGIAGPLAEGVNLVGYLTGELGVGTSARLVDAALQAAGVPTSTDDISSSIESRQGATYRRTDGTWRRTTLLCVNAAETAAVAEKRAALLSRTRVIGMWYWELEDFPVSQHDGFAHVDEVWVATDFMRTAIAPHAGAVRVRTVTPPLPQASGDPGPLPARFGIPEDRPWFLFTFDFLSLAERKNPWGLVEAFTRAFGDLPTAERPTLVIKTINADRHPGDAERLRVRLSGRPDVLHLDTYLDDHERHVLVAHCTAYVSLHRAEGLGLTVAEAMAWGRPVITTRYGGVTQFCNDANSFLVDWAPTRIEEAVGPYEQGLTWAEPDLDHAASLMRLVVAEPERAAAVGQRAARDVRKFHSARSAGVRMRAALEEGDRDGGDDDGAGGTSAVPGLASRVRAAVARRRGRR